MGASYTRAVVILEAFEERSWGASRQRGEGDSALYTSWCFLNLILWVFLICFTTLLFLIGLTR